jgi:hypothetical protein
MSCNVFIVASKTSQMRWKVLLTRSRMKGEWLHFNKYVHMEEQDRSLAEVVVVLPSSNVRVMLQQPSIHKLNNLIVLHIMFTPQSEMFNTWWSVIWEHVRFQDSLFLPQRCLQDEVFSAGANAIYAACVSFLCVFTSIISFPPFQR